MNKFFTKIIGASLAIAMMIGVGAGVNTNNRPTTELTVSSGKLTRGSSAMSITLGGSSGAWTFHTDNYEGTAGYFGQGNQTSNNYLKIYSSVGTGAAGDTWTISFNGDAAVITSTKKTSRNIIRCNTTGTPISCYSSGGQNPVYLWKEVAATNTPSIVFSKDAINGDTGEEFSFTYEASNLTEDIVWTPSNNETNIIDYMINEETKTVSGILSNPGTVTLTATSGTASDSIVFNVVQHFTNRLYTVTDKNSVAQ